jgi:adenosylcobinamide kinase/adenosylcobinamide-phosphate guanylyltransferase
LRDAPTLTFVLGGARSGKSRHAEAIVETCAPPWIYLATAQAFDDEMVARIAQHRSRRNTNWQTHETPLDVADVLAQAPEGRPLLLDCATLWLTNVMLAERDVEAECRRLVDALQKPRGPWIVVSNEVGSGIVPENALARRFADEAGKLNQAIAARADTVLLMVAGIAMQVK